MKTRKFFSLTKSNFFISLVFYVSLMAANYCQENKEMLQIKSLKTIKIFLKYKKTKKT